MEEKAERVGNARNALLEAELHGVGGGGSRGRRKGEGKEESGWVGKGVVKVSGLQKGGNGEDV